MRAITCPQKELEAAEKRVKELQDDLAAVQFTPHSKHGKLLMAKCRTLQEENTEIGREASEGKVSQNYVTYEPLHVMEIVSGGKFIFASRHSVLCWRCYVNDKRQLPLVAILMSVIDYFFNMKDQN